MCQLTLIFSDDGPLLAAAAAAWAAAAAAAAFEAAAAAAAWLMWSGLGVAGRPAPKDMLVGMSSLGPPWGMPGIIPAIDVIRPGGGTPPGN